MVSTYAKITVAGVTTGIVKIGSVIKTISENNAVSNFNLTIKNQDGLSKADYTIGDEVVIYVEQDVNPATAKVFTGVLEDIDFVGKGVSEELIISGRDYTAVLQDNTVQPVVYNDDDISVIVKDIIDNNVDGITYVNVPTATGKVVDHISFNHKNVYDAIKQLAVLGNLIFWVDEDKDLHLVAKNTVSSGVTLDKTNITKSSFKETDKEIANEVWVYGDRQLSGWQNNFTTLGAGTTGSTFTLDYKPHNTIVYVAGSTVPKRGAVAEMLSTPQSGVDYVVNYNDASITFVSGTEFGDRIPVSGNAVQIDYQRSTPIIKVGTDRTSIGKYKKKVKIITDKDIKDPRTAKDMVASELEENAYPKKQGSLSVNEVLDLTPGETVIVDLPNSNVDEQTYNILQVKYDLNKTALFNNNVLTIKVNKKIKDVTDTIKQMALDIKKLQGSDIEDSDVISRLETDIGSVGVRVKNWTVLTRGIGDSFVLGHALNGKLGSPAVGIGGGQVELGSATIGTLTVQQSGGTF